MEEELHSIRVTVHELTLLLEHSRAEHFTLLNQLTVNDAELLQKEAVLVGHLAETAKVKDELRLAQARVSELMDEVQHITSDHQQRLHDAEAALITRSEEVTRLKQSLAQRQTEQGEQAEAHTLNAQRALDHEQTLTSLRLSLQQATTSLTSLQAEHAQLQSELTRLHSSLTERSSQLRPVKGARSTREEVVEKALEMVREELREERRKMVKLQDVLAQCDTQGVRRRVSDRTMSLPSVAFVHPALIALSPRPTLPTPSSIPPHPLYEATAELRACYSALRNEYEDCVESKLTLVRTTATEVESMRDELREWRNEEWERVRAVDRVKRRMKGGQDGWHEAREAKPEGGGGDKCSIM
jgi:myosin heavy subunit